MFDGAKLILHLVPLEAFTATSPVIDLQAAHDFLRLVAPMGTSVFSDRVNIDGILVFNHDNNLVSRSYIQFYRSGVIESVAVFQSENGVKKLWGYIDRYLVQALGAYLAILRRLQINSPVFLMISLTNAKGYELNDTPVARYYPAEYTPLDRDVLLLAESVIEDFEEPTAQILRPSLDALWNAFGFIRSFNFDIEGKWIEPR